MTRQAVRHHVRASFFYGASTCYAAVEAVFPSELRVPPCVVVSAMCFVVALVFTLLAQRRSR